HLADRGVEQLVGPLAIGVAEPLDLDQQRDAEFTKVAIADDAQQRSALAVDDRQVADLTVLDQPNRLADGRGRPDAQDRAGHDRFDAHARGVARRSPANRARIHAASTDDSDCKQGWLDPCQVSRRYSRPRCFSLIEWYACFGSHRCSASHCCCPRSPARPNPPPTKSATTPRPAAMEIRETVTATRATATATASPATVTAS